MSYKEHPDKLICPYCGAGYGDKEDYGSDNDFGLLYCESCDKEFYGHRDVSVTYISTPATYGTCSNCGEKYTVIEDYCSSLGSYKDLCVECGDKRKKEFCSQYA